jgi:hypothetical protein
MSNVFDVIAKIGFKADTSGLGQATKGVEALGKSAKWSNDSLKKLGEAGKRIGAVFTKAALGIGAASAGLVTLAAIANKQQSLDFFKNKAVGISADFAENLGAYFSAVGLNAESVTNSVKSMNEVLGKNSIQEMKKTGNALKALGLDFKEIQKMKPEEQFKAITSAAAGLANKQEAAAASAVLLGSDGQAMVAHLRETGKSATEAEKAMARLNMGTNRSEQGAIKMTAAMNGLSFISNTLKDTFFGLLGESLAPMIDKFNNWIIANKELINQKMEEWAPKVAKGIEQIAVGFGKVWNFLTDDATWITAKNQLEALKQLFIDLKPILYTVGAYLGIIGARLVFTSAIAGVQGLIFAFKTLTVVMMKNPIIFLAAVIIAAFASIYETVSENASFIKALWGELVDYLSVKWTVVKDAIVSGIQTVWAWFSNLLNNPFIAAIGTIFTPLLTVPAMIIKYWEPIKTFFADLYNTYLRPLISGIGKIASTFGINVAADSGSVSPVSGQTSGSFSEVVNSSSRNFNTSSNVTNNMSINVSGAGNMDEKKLAREIKRQLDGQTGKAYAAASSGVVY